MIKKLLYILVILLFAGSLQAATYYISKDGGGNGSACNNAYTMAWANANLAAGDTAKLCDDDDSFVTGICPAATGTPGNYITYEEEAGETVVIAGVLIGVGLGDRNYIHVKGITFTNPTGEFVSFNDNCASVEDNTGSTYNIIEDNIFTHTGNSGTWTGILLSWNADYNQILNNTITISGTVSGNGLGLNGIIDDGIYIYKNASYNLIYGNTVTGGQHYPLAQVGESAYYNVWSNNTATSVHHAIMNVVGGASNGSDWTLIDSNTLVNPGDDERLAGRDFGNNYNLQIDGDNHIVRRNIFGVTDDQTTTFWEGAVGSYVGVGNTHKKTTNMHFYHNVMYRHLRGFSIDWGQTDAIDCVDNIFKNNISYAHSGEEVQFHIIAADDQEITYNSWTPAVQTFDYKALDGVNDSLTDVETSYSDEWSNNISALPAFTNTASFATMDWTLTSASGVIDVGTHLTVTSGTGDGDTALTVVDAGYFYTTGSPWNTPGTTMANDTIYVNAATPFTTTITAINYTTNTLTLAAVQTWQDGVEVYHCPDGNCYVGSAPDLGVNEYALQVYGVLPADGASGVNTTAPATWDHTASVDDVELWLDIGACDGTPLDDDLDCINTDDCVGDESSADADKTYDMSTLTIVTAYCLTLMANDGALQGAFQQFDFTTTGGPPTPVGSKTSISYSPSGGSITHDDSGITIE